MTLVVPNDGEEFLLKGALNHTAPENQRLKLYTNNITPGETDTAATYTEMATQGYAFKALTGSSWTITPGAPTEAAYAEQVWTFDGTGGSTNVYCYFVIQATSGKILWAERFASPTPPWVVANNGDQIKVTPTITLD